MATPIAMPRLGMTMREGKIVAWPLALGERVEKGRVVLVIESEKAEVEVEATAAGFFRHVYVEVGEVVPCATLLGVLTETLEEPFDAEAFARDYQEAAPSEGGASAVASAPPRPAPEARAARGGRRPIAPAARALARELGVDLARVPGGGPGGRVTKADVAAWAAARAGLVEVAPGVALEVPAQGAGEPVLLLPGFGTDVSVFARQVGPLSASYRVLGVNPRGVGSSDAPEQECYSVTQCASDAAAVCDAPAHVIGASLGAAVALELALAHPRHVRSLTLLAPFVEASPRLLAVIDGWCRVAAAADPATLARALLPWFFSSASLRDASGRERTLRGLSETLSRVPATTLARSAAGLRAWSGTRRDRLADVAAPTLVVAGGADLLTAEAPAIAAGIPGARCVVVPEAGHAVALEAPERVNRAIERHLAGE